MQAGALSSCMCLVTVTSQTQAHVIWTHTMNSSGKPLLHFRFSLSFFNRCFYLENPIMRQSKMKYETVLKDETPTQLLRKSRE